MTGALPAMEAAFLSIGCIGFAAVAAHQAARAHHYGSMLTNLEKYIEVEHVKHVRTRGELADIKQRRSEAVSKGNRNRVPKAKRLQLDLADTG